MFFATNNESSPRVVLVQMLLRQHGYDVPVTGTYDRATDAAVCAFRAQHHLAPSGPVNPTVFFHLVQGSKLKIIDSVDASAGQFGEDSMKDMRRNGIKPLENERIPGYGVEHAVKKIIERARDHRIALLRITGHGNRGTWISVAIGDPVHTRERSEAAYQRLRADWKSYIDVVHVDKLKGILKRLTPLFAQFGSAEIHGCMIGTQRDLLQTLANIWGVPVSGGLDLQYGGAYVTNDYGELVSNTFTLLGPVFTAYPGRLDLSSWAASVGASVEAQIQGFAIGVQQRFRATFSR